MVQAIGPMQHFLQVGFVAHPATDPPAPALLPILHLGSELDHVLVAPDQRSQLGPGSKRLRITTQHPAL